MRVKRRHVLAGGLTSVALMGAGFTVAMADMQDGVAAFIRRSFPDLDMAEEDLQAFAGAMTLSMRMSNAKQSVFATMLNSRGHEQIGSYVVPDRLERAQGEIVAMFLRSTNYADPDREDAPVIFFGFADPYTAGCSNPLAGWTSSECSWPA